MSILAPFFWGRCRSGLSCQGLYRTAVIPMRSTVCSYPCRQAEAPSIQLRMQELHGQHGETENDRDHKGHGVILDGGRRDGAIAYARTIQNLRRIGQLGGHKHEFLRHAHQELGQYSTILHGRSLFQFTFQIGPVKAGYFSESPIRSLLSAALCNCIKKYWANCGSGLRYAMLMTSLSPAGSRAIDRLIYWAIASPVGGLSS